MTEQTPCAPDRKDHCWHFLTDDETKLPPVSIWVCCYCQTTSTREWDRPKNHGAYLPISGYPRA